MLFRASGDRAIRICKRGWNEVPLPRFRHLILYYQSGRMPLLSNCATQTYSDRGHDQALAEKVEGQRNFRVWQDQEGPVQRVSVLLVRQTHQSEQALQGVSFGAC
jgi:hypothetical protein